MRPLLLEAMAIATGGLLSVGSILIVLLLLSTPQGLRKGLAYYLGYSLSYLAIGTVFVVAGGRLHDSRGGGQGTGPPFRSIVFLLLGALLLFFAVRKWRMPQGEDAGPPRWLATLDRTRPRKLFGFGALVTVLNFKNMAIYLSAVAVIPGSGLSVPESAIVLVAVVLTFCGAVLFPLVLFALFSERATPLLEAMKRGLTRHNRVIGIVLLACFGALFLVRGLLGLG